MKGERVVQGIACSEVLASLLAYLAAELDPGECDRIEAHLRGCDACTRFGGRYARIVQALRDELLAEEVPVEVKTRLEQALEAATGARGAG